MLEKSTIPPALVMNCALPPLLLAKNWLFEPLLVTMVAFAALQVSVKVKRPPPLFVIVAVPAVLVPVNVVAPGVLFMVAFPAVALLSNSRSPNALNSGAFDELLTTPLPSITSDRPDRSNE